MQDYIILHINSYNTNLDPSGQSINVLENPNQQELGFSEGQIEIRNNSFLTTTSLYVPSTAITRSSSKCTTVKWLLITVWVTNYLPKSCITSID